MTTKSEVVGYGLFVPKIAVAVAALMILTLVSPAAAQSFTDPVTYTLASENPGRAATGDLDGDGDADFAVPTYVSGSPGYVEVLLDLEAGSSATPTAYRVGHKPRSVAAADLDGDGDLDLAVANWGDGTVSVLVNRGDGTFDAAVDHAAGSYPSVAVAGDLDGDGLADLAVANTYDVLWLANNGDGTFAAPQSYAFGSRIVGLDIGEMDGDTDLDLVVLQMAEGSNIREAWVTVLWNDGSGTFEASPRYEGGSWSDGYDYALHPSVDSLALGDLTGNGYLDVLVGATLGWRTLPLDGSPLGRVNVLENWGGGSLMPGESRGSCHDHQPQLDTGDLDGDGDLEVVTGRVYFLNIGAGYFGGSQGHGGDGKYVTVDDLYPDGLPDLVLPRDPYSVQVVFQGDVCPGDPNKVEPGQCGCGQLDTDSDGDGVADCNDQCPGEPDTDSDGDGVADCLDLCPDDPGKVDPGVCGCGVPDEDTDGDGTLDCLDLCPDDPGKVDPGVCGCGMADVDSDGDGALDCDDVCMGFDDTVDCNGNGMPDGCEIESGPFVDDRRLIASDGAADDWFGYSVSIHGDTIVVAAPYDDDRGTDAGSVYAYRHDTASGLWAEEQKLTASDGAADDEFGLAVSTDGDTIVVGAFGDDDLGSDSGSAYVFRYDPTRSEGDRWVEEPKLTASDGAISDYFGVAVSIHGDTIVVGASGDDDLGSSSGSAYVYRYDAVSGLWAEEQKLTASDGAADDSFGLGVSIHGDTIVVGASGDDDLGSSSGSAYVYRYDAVSGLWAEEQKLTASDGAIHDYFGRNVSIHGDTIVVGVSFDDDLGYGSGSAYVYRYDAVSGLWAEEQKLTASDGAAGDEFGLAVSTDGDTIVVGARGDDDLGENSGSVYVYRHDTASGLWAEEQKLTASDGSAGDFFGYSVSTDGDTIVVGAFGDDDLGSNSGSAYTYERSVSDDCDGDGVPDECQPDTDLDGLIDACDCDPDNVDCTTDCSDNNGNGIPDCGEPAGGPRTVTETGTVASGEEDHYGPYTVEESTEFAARLTTLINNADLYVRWDQAPTTSQFDCSATTPYVLDECVLTVPVGVTEAYVMVYGSHGSPSGYSLQVDWVEPGGGCADDDGDGVCNGDDPCPSDPDKIDPGVCGCGYPDTDRDLDGVPDCVDVCPGFPDTLDCNVNGMPDGCEIESGPFVDDRELIASDGAAWDEFGTNVAIDGNAFVVAAPYDDDRGTDAGSVYAYRYDPVTGGWAEEPKLTASDGAAGDSFGRYLSMHGDTIAVGAWGDDDLGPDSGSAYVYRYDGATWNQEQKLTAFDGAAGDEFGEDIAIHGDTLAIGAWADDDLGSSSGSVYVYRYDGNNWNHERKLTASDGDATDRFGYRVSIHGDTIVVGALNDDDLGSNSGSAYVYRYDGATWNQEQKLTASDGAAGDRFGLGVSIHGDTVVVGAWEDDDLGTDSGSAYVYRYDGATWNQEQKLTASDGAAGDLFGENVSTDGGTIVVGSSGDDDLGSDSGSVYVYRYDAVSGLWVEEPKLTAPDGVAGDEFGLGVAIDNGTIVAGAHGRDDHGESSGAAYTFERPGTVSDCDRDGVPDECQPDTDSDGDGIADCVDQCPGQPDTDADGDGIADCVDECPAGTGDPVVFILDRCPGDPNKIDPGQCGCGQPEIDADGDGYYCASDCDDASAGSWATPGEVAGLSFGAGTKDDLSWGEPLEPGCSAPRYDMVRSDFADDFGAATCIESGDGSDRTATDVAVPDPGMVYHYLVRAENDCPTGQGTLGHDSQGVERSTPICQ